MLKKVLKWSLIVIGIFIIILISIPFFFKNEIKEFTIKEVNKTLLADVELGEFDLTFLSSFPKIAIKLEDTKVTGRDLFKGVELVNIKEFEAKLNFWSVVSGDQIEIDEIYFGEPTFDVRIMKDGKANYDIVKPDSLMTEEEVSEPSNFKLTLKKYKIEGANIRYNDQQGDMFAEILNLDHLGKGDLTEVIVDFATETSMDELTFEMEGIDYLSKVKTTADATIKIEFNGDDMKFTMQENEFKLNALTFSIDGFYEMLKGYDDLDLKFSADKATFKDFLSLIPAFYHSGYEGMLAEGKLAFKGKVKGRMDEVNMPGWDFGMSVQNAKIKYPDLPGSISNIQLKVDSKYTGGADMDKMTLDIDKFHADFVGNTLEAKLKMRNLMTDPLLDSKILAKVDLSTLGKVMPLAEGESYKGKMKADVILNGRMSALENENYEAFKAEGTVLLNDIEYLTTDLPEKVNVQTFELLFSPQNLSLTKLDAQMGKSDFQMAGKIDNYLAYVMKDELLKGSFTFRSHYLDVDQLMGTSEETSEDTTSTSSSDEQVSLPDNIDFNLNTSIDKIMYNGIEISNLKGGIILKDEVAQLNDLVMNTMGGEIGLTGSFNTQNHDSPEFDFGYQLNGIDIKPLAENFITIQKLAPIANYASGKISTSFQMKGDLKPNLDPVYNSLFGNGDLFTEKVTVSGFEPLNKLGNALSMKELSSQTINNLKAIFKFEQGRINVTPFDVKLGGVATNVSGYTTFEQQIDYALKMNVPKEKIPGDVLKVVESQVKKINSLAPQIDVKGLPAMIPVNVKIKGLVTNPKVETDFKDALLKATGDLKGGLKDLGTDLLDKGKDSIKAIVESKVNEVKEDLEQKKQQLLDDAQKQADKIKEEGKKAGDAIRAASVRQADALIKEAGTNPIKKKAAEIAGDKLKKTADEKAQKLEREANDKADAIMKTARDKANQLK